MKVFLLIMALAMAGCGVSKKSMRAKDRETSLATDWENLPQQVKDSALTIYNSMRDNRIDYRTFSAKAKLNYQDAYGKQPEGTVVIRMKKDSAIWVSVSGSLLNLEVARIYITPDSLTILNKLDKYVEYHPYAYLQTITNLPVDFQTLQELLAGNYVFTGDSIIGYQNTGSEVLLAVSGYGYKNTFQVSDDRRVSKSTLLDKKATNNRKILFYYADYQTVNHYIFPFYREIYVEDESKAHAVLQFTQVEFNKELSISFNIPSNYKTK